MSSFISVGNRAPAHELVSLTPGVRPPRPPRPHPPPLAHPLLPRPTQHTRHHLPAHVLRPDPPRGAHAVPPNPKARRLLLPVLLPLAPREPPVHTRLVAPNLGRGHGAALPLQDEGGRHLCAETEGGGRPVVRILPLRRGAVYGRRDGAQDERPPRRPLWRVPPCRRL